MRKLVEDGRIFVARPPLFKVSQKKHIRYVQAAEEMNTELMTRGLDGAKLNMLSDKTAGEVATTIEGERLTKLVKVLSELEEAIGILERRGFGFGDFLGRVTKQGLPLYRVLLGTQASWFVTSQEVDTFRLAEHQRLGHELVVADDLPAHSSGIVQRVWAAGSPFRARIPRGLVHQSRPRTPEGIGPDGGGGGCRAHSRREPLPRFQLESRETKHFLAQCAFSPRNQEAG